MRPPTQLFALPAALLLLIASSPARASTKELQWPYNLPPHVKYYPEHEALVRRDVEIRQRLQQQPAAGVRKMSDDPGEMFFLDYWLFAPSPDGHVNYTERCDKAAGQASQLRPQHANESSLVSFGQPFPLHLDHRISDSSILPRHLRFPLFERSILDSRGFQCPNGTAACTALNPNVCCAIGETCQTVQDTGTGLGTVGCCPDGETCTGSLSTCPSGYTSCPSNPGGGCCIPGYACYDVGCVLTATIFVTPAVTATSSSTLPPSTSTTAISTSLTHVVPPVTYTPSSVDSTISPSSVSTSATTTTKTTSSTSTTTQITCVSGFQSCAASLGGGCCSNNMVCGPGKTCLPRSSTISVVAPYRPTSVLTTTTSTTHSSISGAGCPTGYYACSAYYPGGCCQIGRDCSSTSCPASASTTLFNSHSLTIVAPTGSSISLNPAGTSGTFASGWYSCAATNGGGWCPSGYACGAMCTATASGGQGNVVGKGEPSRAVKMCVTKDLWFVWMGIFVMVIHVAFR